MANSITLLPSLLLSHPQNPRPRLTEAEVAELRASIEAHGQKQPCVVRPLGENGSTKYQVIIGHRRAFVGRLLNREVPCLVEDLDDDEALALMLSDNRVRTDPDPFMESKAVDVLLQREGHTLQSVADLLGKPPRWVAQRANLRTLTKKSREALGRAGWPVSWLEEWARLSPGAQDAEVEKVSWVKDGRQLQGVISRYLRVLGKAPWAMDDTTLLPKAGSCSACPKQSMASPGLFGEEGEKDVRKATCRDSLCWKAKADANVAQTLATIRETEPDLVLVAADIDAKTLPSLKGEKVLDVWTVQPSKKGTKGSLQAAKVTSDGRVTRTYIQPSRSSQSASKANRKTAKEMTPKERLTTSKARIEKRRKAYVLQSLRDLIKNADAPSIETVMGLVAAYRISPCMDSGTLKAKKTRYAIMGKDWAREVWERMRRHLADALNWNTDEALDRAYEEGEWLAGFLDIKVAELEAKAAEEVPDPKWWTN